MPNPEPSPVSPLAAIREKERILAQEIRAAEERASTTVAEARARADTIKQQAEQEGLKDADALYKQGLQKAEEQAKGMSAEGEARAAELRAAGLGCVQKAVDYIVQFVLPRTGS